MTSTPAPAPAGWYPAPDGSPTSWWWDGMQWIQPAPQPGGWSLPIEVPTRLAAVTQALLIACGVASVASIGLEAFGISVADRFFSGDYRAVDSLDTYDRISFVLGILTTAILVATGVLWVVWQYKVAKQVPGQTRRSAGWHAGSWFIPFIALVYPYQNISDLWGAVGRRRPPWLLVWWLAWIISSIVSQVAARIFLGAESLELYSVGMGVSILAEVLSLVALPFAVMIVRGITSGLTERTGA